MKKKIAKTALSPYIKLAASCVLSFSLTFILYIVIFKSLSFYPFNEDGLTTLMLDQRDQYIAYMRAYQSILKNGGSLVYTLGKPIGGDFQSLFTYYLSSPFNLLLIFFSSGDIPAFFFYTSIIKMSFASLNMVLLAYYEKKETRIGYIAFAVAYGLISYALVYLSNFMYLDCLMLLPLVLLGLRSLEEGKTLWIYPSVLAFSLISNWYVGAMICIFSLLFFLTRFSFQKQDIRKRMSFLLRFLVFSLLGGLISSFIWIAAFSHFSGTKVSISLPYFRFFNWASFFEGLLENNYLSHSAISRNTGYMTMFVSVPALLFAMLYFTNKGYSWRDKAGDGTVLFIYFLVSLTNVTNALFHGGKEPTWFPARYSFIIGFYICCLANKEVSEIDKTPLWGYIVPTGVCAIILPILAYAKTNELGKNGVMILYPISVISLLIFIVALLVVFLYSLKLNLDSKKERKAPSFIKPALEVSIVLLTVLSSYRGAKNVVNVNVKEEQYQSVSVYKADDELSSVFAAVKEADTSIYRMESTFNRNGSNNTIDNNPLFYSYNGLSHYSSTKKAEVSSYMSKIGFQRNAFWERYDGGSTLAINSFLGLKYLVDDSSDATAEKPMFIYNDSPKNPFKQINLSGSDVNSPYVYYRNEAALPLGFAIPKSDGDYIDEVIATGENGSRLKMNHFEYQNALFYALSDEVKDDEGKKKAIFRPLSIKAEYLSSGASISSVDEFEEKTYRLEKGSYIQIDFLIPEEASGNNLYVCEKNLTDGVSYYLDRQRIGLADYRDNGIHSFLGKAGSSHSLIIRNLSDTPFDKKIVPELYYEDLSVLNEYLSSIKKEASSNLKESGNFVSSSFEGDFTLEEKGDKEFIFTLPYESNFKIFVDGKRKDTVRRLDLFVAVSISDLEKGKHHIKIVYEDAGLLTGTIISSISLLSFAPIMIFYPRLEKKIFKKKEEAEAQ